MFVYLSLSPSLSISICISVSQHESLVTGTRLEPYQGPTDPFLGCSPPPPQTHYSPSPPKPHRLLLSLSLCISERSRIEHNPRNQPDRLSESSIRSVGLSVGRRRQRQTGRHLGPSLRHRCSLPGTLFPRSARRWSMREKPNIANHISASLSLSKPRSFSLSINPDHLLFSLLSFLVSPQAIPSSTAILRSWLKLLIK